MHVFDACVATSQTLLAILSLAENRPRGTPLFVSTLLLKDLGGRPGERMAFCGEQKPNKQDNISVVGERFIDFCWPPLHLHTFLAKTHSRLKAVYLRMWVVDES